MPGRPSPARLAAAPLAMALVMLLVAAVGEFVVEPSGRIRALDVASVDRSRAWLGGVGLEHAALVWAEWSRPWVVHTLVLAVTLALLWAGAVRLQALLVPLIGLLGWGLGALGKLIVARPRPTPVDPITTLDSWSYPSGHATSAALGAVLLLALLSSVRPPWIRRPATVLVLVAAGLTAAHRVPLGVHFPSDVIAGVTLGTATALVGLGVLRPLRPDPASP